MLSATKTTALAVNDCVLFANFIYDGTQIMTAAREGVQIKCKYGCCVKGNARSSFKSSSRSRSSSYGICLIHESRIVDEDYSIDWAVREEAQIPFHGREDKTPFDGGAVCSSCR